MKTVKSYVIAAIMAALCVGGAIAQDSVTYIYDLKMSVKIPVVKNGIRSYSTCPCKGYMFLEYNEDGELVDVYAEYVNSKTKVAHYTSFSTDMFYYLMGKTTKHALRSTPTLYFNGADVDLEPLGKTDDVHEEFTAITLAGNGKIKSTKNVVITGCGPCGEQIKTTEYCNILDSASGNLTGIASCLCPDDGTWWHTLKTTICGTVIVDFSDCDSLNESRSHDAAIYGTWMIKFNNKLNGFKL